MTSLFHIRQIFSMFNESDVSSVDQLVDQFVDEIIPADLLACVAAFLSPRTFLLIKYEENSWGGRQDPLNRKMSNPQPDQIEWLGREAGVIFHQ